MTGNTYLSQMKILYVEDDDDTREDLRRYLKKKAGKVITAANGKEGLVKYAEERPDIVIADILLPEMNGMDMLKEIRRAGEMCIRDRPRPDLSLVDGPAYKAPRGTLNSVIATRGCPNNCSF